MKREDFKISGFKTPENYFENFEENLFSRFEENNFPKSTGFNVPNGYFESVEMKVLDSCSTSEEKTKVIPLFPRKYLRYAAVIAACILIGAFIFNSVENKSNIDSIQIGLIDKYIEEGNLNIDLYDLTTYLEPQNIEIYDFNNLQISETSLKRYLLENTDEEILYDEQ